MALNTQRSVSSRHLECATAIFWKASINSGRRQVHDALPTTPIFHRDIIASAFKQLTKMAFGTKQAQKCHSSSNRVFIALSGFLDSPRCCSWASFLGYIECVFVRFDHSSPLSSRSAHALLGRFTTRSRRDSSASPFSLSSPPICSLNRVLTRRVSR